MASVGANDYAKARSGAVSRCEGIDPNEYQSGLVFNPDGYRSFYVRSECFQKAAVQFRDESLCAHVRQLRSLFSSSWGYSSGRCRQMVAEGIAADRAALEEMKRNYAAGSVRLRAFQIERNGNGRDFDIVLVFSGRYAHGYVLTFEILDGNSSNAAVLLHSSGYYLDAASNLRIYVRQSDIRERFVHFALNRPYQVRATVVLDVGTGGPAGSWSDAFIERVFPVKERSQTLRKESVF
ncbi:MAG: hypothetical protein C5B57_06965 [Blastocatellia bacterium]|nr:MAG: hypothetical protein C5B57_06965 [Blastocatellia bacterium]